MGQDIIWRRNDSIPGSSTKTLAEEQLGIAHVEAGTNYWNNNITSTTRRKWSKDEKGKLAIDWDSDENLTKIRNRVDLVLKGCSCKGGCSTNRCGCRRKGIHCGVGCGCTGLYKQGRPARDNIMPVDSNTDSSTDESDTEQENDDLDTYVNKRSVWTTGNSNR